MIWQLLALVVVFSASVCSADVTPANSNIVHKNGSSANLIWNMNLNNYSVIAVRIEQEQKGNFVSVAGLIYGKKLINVFIPSFKTRLSLNRATYKIFSVKIDKLQFTDAGNYRLVVTLDSANILRSEKLNLEVKVSFNPTEKDTGTNAGVIAGAVIGAIIFIAVVIILVVLYLRWKKNNPSSTVGNKETVGLRSTHGPNDETEYGNYAAAGTGVPASSKPTPQVYAELGPGGGRTGPKPPPNKSVYAEVKVDEDGYPASGPSAPSKPERVIAGNYSIQEPTGVNV